MFRPVSASSSDRGIPVSRRAAYVAIVLGLAAVGWLTFHRVEMRPRARPRGGSAPASRADFVGSAACSGCHRSESAAWTGSHHALAMQSPSTSAVLGDFHGSSFTAMGVNTRFETSGGKFFVTTEGADGKPATFEVRSVIGVAPVQQYLIALPGGKLQCLTVAWDTAKHRWYSLYPGQRIAVTDPLHWTGRYQGWNLMCADCHTTDFRKGYDLGADTYRSSWAEFDVGCEACHGPGRAHIAWARAASAQGKPMSSAHRAFGQTDTRIASARPSEDSRAEVDGCAPCHSRRYRIGAARGPADPILDEYMPEVARAPLYYPDGQVHDEVYEYTSFRQSKMYQRGVRCTDCHDPHSGKLRAEGNALCTRCHQLHPNPLFPTLQAKEYDAPSHHHHPPGSPGSQCVSCHMPTKTFMIVDARRDHFLRPPRPDESATLGTPNACNACHTDRSPGWAAGALRSWYREPKHDARYAPAVIAGRASTPGADSLLVPVFTDRTRSVMARASALDLLRGYPGAATRAAREAARDPDPLLRATAAQVLDAVPFSDRVAIAAPLLEDSVRAVRVAAARVLGSTPRALLSTAQIRSLDAATVEYRDGLDAMADMPSTHLNLAILEEERGRSDLAVEAYERALRMDPYFLPARSNLANLLNRLHRNGDAERELREGMRLLPKEGELPYSLGLLLAEDQQYEEAARVLTQAAELLPIRARVRYNLALVLYKLERDAEGDRALAAAGRLDPIDVDILYAEAYRYAARHDWSRALPPARKLAELQPGNEDVQRLLQSIEAQLARRSE